MDELMIAFEMLQEISPRTNRMNLTAFGSFYCMLLEEWCKANNEDITIFIDDIYKMILEVNAEMGTYK